MEGHIEDHMSRGIDASAVIVVFVTAHYLDKVAGSATDNCKLEFNYATARKPAGCFVPVVMEAAMRDQRLWRGSVGMHLNKNM
jgi:hypothetical protein